MCGRDSWWKMDDLLNWRRKIGCFGGGRPKTRWRWDPYGGKRVLTWHETLFGGLCFLAAVLAAYSFVDEVHQADLRTLVRCSSVWENPGWKRKRGWRCEEDLVSGGLTVGSVWVVSAFSAWGVHELYRRLKLLWGGTIERNPGPVEKQIPEDVSGAGATPSQAAKTTTTASGSSAPVGLLLVGGHSGTGTKTRAGTRASASRQGDSQTPVDTSTSVSARTDSGETVQKPDNNDGTGAKTGKRAKAAETGDDGQHSVAGSTNVVDSTISSSETVTSKPSAPDKEKDQRCSDKTATNSGVLQPVAVRPSGVCQKGNSDLSKKPSKGRESMDETGVCEEGKGEVGGDGGGGGVSGVSRSSGESLSVSENVSRPEDICEEAESDVLSESVQTMLNVSCELDYFANGQTEDSEDEVSENERKKEEENGDESEKEVGLASRKDSSTERDRNRNRRGKQTRKSDGVMSFVKDQMKSMIGAIQNLTTELKAGQEDVKKRQEDFTRGQEDMRKGQDDMRRGQEELKREMREEIRGVQKNQTDQKEQIDQVLEKVEATQGKIEGLRGDIQKTQDEVRKNREDIQELKQKQEEARAEADQHHKNLEQEFDKLDSHSRRNNLKFFGVPEEGRGQREDSEGVVLRLLSQHIPEGGWKREHCEKAQRLGKRREGEENSKPRPLLAMFSRPGDARKILSHKKARGELRDRGIQVSTDLTQRQQQQLRDLRSSGQRGYFFRGNLVIQGENDRGGRGGRGWGARGGVRGGAWGARGGVNQSLGQSSGQFGARGAGRGGRGRGNNMGNRGAQNGNNWIQEGNQGQGGAGGSDRN